MRRKTIVLIIGILLAVSIMGGQVFASDGSTGSLTAVVANVSGEQVVVGITDYALAYTAGKGNQLFDYLAAGKSSINLSSVVSGSKYLNITQYALNYTAYGSMAGAITNTGGLTDIEKQHFKRFDGFDSLGNPILTPLFAMEGHYFVVFNTNGGSPVESQTIASGAAATKPADPTRTGYSFVDWYADSSLTQVFDFNTAITGNMTLYAKWDLIYQNTISLGDKYLGYETPYLINGGNPTGNSANNNAHFDAVTNILTLNNYNGGAISWTTNANLTIVLNGANTIATGGIDAGGFNNSKITIKGSGKLITTNGNIYSPQGSIEITETADVTINYNPSTGFANGIYMSDSGGTTINSNAKLKISVTGNNATYGISGKTNIGGNSEVTINANGGTNYTTGISGSAEITTSKKVDIKTLGGSGQAISSEPVITLDNYQVTGNYNAKDVTYIYRGTPADLQGISVKTPPGKLIYLKGETLNLTGLVVNLHWLNSIVEEVPLTDFLTRGISTVPANGAILTSVGSVPVKITHAASSKFVNQNITVNNAYTVTFKDHDGTVLKSQIVPSGQAATAPTNPSRTGYTFTVWSPAFNSVTSDLIVTAQYSIIKYTVTFNSNGGSSVSPQQVNYNGMAIRPANPTRAEFNFINWYADEALTELFDFNTLITENTALYAKWGAVYTGEIRLNDKILNAFYPYLKNDESYGSSSDYNAYYNAATETLTLKNYDRSGNQTIFGHIHAEAGDLTIVLEGTNTIGSGNIIVANGKLTVNGIGSLTLSNGRIRANGDIAINCGNMTVNSTAATGDNIGIESTAGDIAVTGSTKLSITADGGFYVYGIKTSSGKTLTISGSSDVSITAKNGSTWNRGVGGQTNINHSSTSGKIVVTTIGNGAQAFSVAPTVVEEFYTKTGNWDTAAVTYQYKGLQSLYFEPLSALNIPEGTINSSITPIDLKLGVTGGLKPYIFSKVDTWPAWLQLDVSTGIITGTRPSSVQGATSIKVKVTDSNNPASSYDATFSVGAVVKNLNLNLGGNNITFANQYLKNDGTYGNENDYNAHFDFVNEELILKDYNRTGIISWEDTSSTIALKVRVEGNNTITTTNMGAGISSYSDLWIYGNGKLKLVNCSIGIGYGSYAPGQNANVTLGIDPQGNKYRTEIEVQNLRTSYLAEYSAYGVYAGNELYVFGNTKLTINVGNYEHNYGLYAKKVFIGLYSNGLDKGSPIVTINKNVANFDGNFRGIHSSVQTQQTTALLYISGNSSVYIDSSKGNAQGPQGQTMVQTALSLAGMYNHASVSTTNELSIYNGGVSDRNYRVSNTQMAIINIFAGANYDETNIAGLYTIKYKSAKTISIQSGVGGTASSVANRAPSGLWVEIDAFPSANYIFDKWEIIEGNPTFETEWDIYKPSTKILVGDSNVVIKATFGVPSAITVINSGNGSGTVDVYLKGTTTKIDSAVSGQPIEFIMTKGNKSYIGNIYVYQTGNTSRQVPFVRSGTKVDFNMIHAPVTIEVQFVR